MMRTLEAGLEAPAYNLPILISESAGFIV